MATKEPVPELEVGDKVKCISNTHGYVVENNHLLEIGRVYTVHEVYTAPYGGLLKFTLVEINKDHDREPFYVLDDFEIVKFDYDVAWSRAMSIL